jgi:serine phosphatase RsbU (regulator of sigma subunit)
MLLLTDGVLDALGDEEGEGGVTRVLDLVRAHRDQPASKIVETLCRAARDTTPQESQHDDITAVVLKVKS